MYFELCTTIDSSKAHVIDLKPNRKPTKDPAIQEGKPLPENGACKHYKKSFRWLRFPCCGKTYPCDECHDESEPDHEMKYAIRMICGFCCKEQVCTVVWWLKLLFRKTPMFLANCKVLKWYNVMIEWYDFFCKSAMCILTKDW